MRLLHQSVSGASLLMLLMAVQRLLTFGLNSLLIRSADAATLGFAANDMELLLSTLLFLSRETFRIVALRHGGPGQDGSEESKDARVTLLNLAWTPVVLGVAFSSLAAAGVGWYGPLSAEKRDTALLFCLASAVESLAEPFFVLVQHDLLYRVRVGAEMAATAAKCAATYAGIVFLHAGARAFGYGQVVFSLVLLLWYVSYFVFVRKAEGGLLPQLRDGDGFWTNWLPSSTWSLLLAFIGQSVFLHFLTEGDHVVLALNSTAFDKGVYVVVTNYGSLAARLLFRPIEEATRALMAKTLHVRTTASDGTADGKPADESATVSHAAKVFCMVLRFVVLLGLTIVAFGPNYAHSAVHILLGSRWSGTSVPSTLGVYCAYILTCALNGVGEAFVSAVAREEAMKQLNTRLILIFVGYAIAATGLLRWLGTVGLVWAGCLNMLGRSFSSLTFIQGYVRGHGGSVAWMDAVPSVQVLLAFLAAFIVTRVSLFFEMAMLVHIGVGALTGAALGLVLLLVEGKALRATWVSLRTGVESQDLKEKEE